MQQKGCTSNVRAKTPPDRVDARSFDRSLPAVQSTAPFRPGNILHHCRVARKLGDRFLPRRDRPGCPEDCRVSAIPDESPPRLDHGFPRLDLRVVADVVDLEDESVAADHFAIPVDQVLPGDRVQRAVDEPDRHRRVDQCADPAVAGRAQLATARPPG